MTSDWRRQSTSKGISNEEFLATRSKMLAGKAFMLDIENRQLRMKVAEAIQNSGGEIIASFDERNPQCVVSDHPTAQKAEKWKSDNEVNKEKLLKSMPSLLRQAFSRGIKIRTPQLFLDQMMSYFSRKGKTTSATTSHSTIRGIAVPRREMSARVNRTQIVIPKISRGSSDQSRPEERAFIRIELPGKKPEIRLVNKESFAQLFTGADAGYSIFKRADQSLVDRRQREYDAFLKGNFEPAKKNFKLSDRDTYCQICLKTISGNKKEHERTDEHRQKAKPLSLAPALDRTVLDALLRSQRQEKQDQRRRIQSQEKMRMKHLSKRSGVEYEYGENEMKANWENLKENTVGNLPAKNPSPRRRQNRIRTISSQENSPFM